jgi:hypothetical protein
MNVVCESAVLSLARRSVIELGSRCEQDSHGSEPLTVGREAQNRGAVAALK